MPPTPYAPPGTTTARILALVAHRPGTLVSDLPELVGAPRESVVPEVWRLCRDGGLVATTAFGRVSLRVAA